MSRETFLLRVPVPISIAPAAEAVGSSLTCLLLLPGLDT